MDTDNKNTGSGSGEGPEKAFSWDDHFLGAVTVGERGQVVIPATARKQFHIEPGDKLLMMADPHKRSLMLCKLDSLREFMSAFQAGLEQVEQDMTEGNATKENATAGEHSLTTVSRIKENEE